MVSVTEPAAAGCIGSAHAAQVRVITAALELFSEHGVGGTSLQMIADTIGVTRVVVYHQFKTKDEIVIAAAGTELERVQACGRGGRGGTRGGERGVCGW